MAVKLTDNLIRAELRKAATLVAPARIELRDSQVSGLILRITHTGSAAWSLVFRKAKGGTLTHDRLTLGKYPLVSLAEARTLAMEAVATASRGGNPAMEKRIAKAAPASTTLGELFDEFEKKHAAKLKSRVILMQILRVNARDWLDLPANALTRHTIHSRVEAIMDGTAPGRKRKAPRTAGMFQSILSTAFNFGLDVGIVTTNPILGKSIPEDARSKVRTRVLTDDELRTLLLTDISPAPIGQILRLLAFTACRSREVMEANWEEIDWTERLLTVPPERRKTVRLAPGAFIVPLNSLALDLLRRRWESEGKPDKGLIFRRPKGRLAYSLTMTGLGAVGLQPGVSVEDRWTPHDLRRTARTRWSEFEMADFEVMERSLDHRIPGIAGVYDQSARLNARRELMDKWAAYLRGLVSDDSAVTPLRVG
jgi:integrase